MNPDKSIKGFALVEFEFEDAVERALRLRPTQIGDKQVRRALKPNTRVARPSLSLVSGRSPSQGGDTPGASERHSTHSPPSRRLSHMGSLRQQEAAARLAGGLSAVGSMKGKVASVNGGLPPRPKPSKSQPKGETPPGSSSTVEGPPPQNSQAGCAAEPAQQTPEGASVQPTQVTDMATGPSVTAPAVAKGQAYLAAEKPDGQQSSRRSSEPIETMQQSPKMVSTSPTVSKPRTRRHPDRC